MILYQLEVRKLKKNGNGNKTHSRIGFFKNLKKAIKFVKDEGCDWLPCCPSPKLFFAICEIDPDEIHHGGMAFSSIKMFLNQDGEELDRTQVLHYKNLKVKGAF